MNPNDIDKQLEEIENQIKSLREQATTLRAQKRELLKVDTESESIALVYKLQAQWSVSRPQATVRRFSNWVRARGAVDIYRNRDPKLIVHGDYEELLLGNQAGKLQLKLYVRPEIGTKPYARLTRTFAKREDLDAALPELAYVVISAAARKLADSKA